VGEAHDASKKSRGTDSACKDRDHVPDRNDRSPLEWGSHAQGVYHGNHRSRRPPSG
jgi:hypothetical protein